MSEASKISIDHEQEWDNLLASQAQLMQLQLTLFREEREHTSNNSAESMVFLNEIYGIAKTSIGLLIPLLISTYAYPVIPNISTIRWYILAVILIFVSTIIIHLAYMRKGVKAGERLGESRTKLFVTMMDSLATLVESRRNQVERLDKKMKTRP